MNSQPTADAAVEGGGLVRIRLADVRSGGNRCPQRLAKKIRPDSPRPRRSASSARSLTGWALGPLHEVLDLVEFEQLPVEEALAGWRAEPRRPFHPALVRWTEHALHGYLAASAEFSTARSSPNGPNAAGVVLQPVSRLWARQRRALKPGDPDMYEEMVTDRRYAGDGIRELRLVRTGSVKGRPGDKAEIAVAVGVLAGGSPVLGSEWDKGPLTLGGFEPARLVRLVEIGCADASHRILFEGTPEDAYNHYGSDVEAHIDRLIKENSYRPGDDCGRCDAVATCPAVPSRPGFLGTGGSDLPRRSWSVTTGRSYRQCPARAHLENLFLPKDTGVENSEAVVRGKAVHAWIESRHRRTPPEPCTPDDVPEPQGTWRHGDHVLTGLQARLGIQMIGDHALVCPLRDRPDDAEAHPESPVVVYDPEADVVVIARTDLLYRVDDRWTLRETKTVRALSEGDPLERYPQLALAVLLARAGVLPGDGNCAVELERLTGSGPVVTPLDIAEDVIAQARDVLEKHVSAWHKDARFPTRAGRACADCPFTRWCPDAPERSTG
ncbi:PD-(D/E)XK nuclease family protein [Streptomyces griseoviridis]|uniref:PD-(D/E)XK nuclease family protein n=1 Tax=Streptomyces griseoviridis TaxID=45398 RepID=UPI0034375A8A